MDIAFEAILCVICCIICELYSRLLLSQKIVCVINKINSIVNALRKR